MDCQLKKLNEYCKKNTWLSNLIDWRIPVLWAIKIKIKYFINILKKTFKKKQNKNLINYIDKDIREGDLVKIKPKEKIQEFLDDFGKTKGCNITPEMYERCEGKYKVVKNVVYFYDEVKGRICKCKDIYLLENSLCSGKRKLFREQCDRNCYQFWHKSWMEKIE